MSENDKNSVAIVTSTEPASIIAEAYRTIRTSIKYSSIERDLKIIMITSSMQNEGKTTVVSNLAILAAQEGNKVLLIDADMRRPHLHHIFHLFNRNGLGNMLTSYADPMESVQQTDLPNLSLLTAGPIQSQPSELLGLTRFDSIIDRFRGRFDLVFLDTPPILTVTDATLIARAADGIVVVVRAMFSRREHLLQTQKLLLPFRDKVLGTVMNDGKVVLR